MQLPSGNRTVTAFQPFARTFSGLFVFPSPHNTGPEHRQNRHANKHAGRVMHCESKPLSRKLTADDEGRNYVDKWLSLNRTGTDFCTF